MRFLALLPPRPTIAVAGGFGRMLGALRLVRRGVVEHNLRIAFGDTMHRRERNRVAAALGGHLFMFVAETIFQRYRDRAWVDGCITEVRGREHLDRFIAEKKGFLSVGGHFGNWELMGAHFGGWGTPVHPVSKRLHSPLWQAWTEALRSRHGLDVFWVDEETSTKVLKALRAGENVNFLADQDAGMEGIFIPFFGRPASTIPSPALFAIRARCPILPAYIVRLGPASHRIEIKEPIDPTEFKGSLEERIVAIMTVLARHTEDMAKLHPGQYFWVHNRWKSTPEAIRKRKETLEKRKVLRTSAK